MTPSRLHVLIVDDCATMRRMIARALRASGFSLAGVYEAGEGNEALRILDSRRVDFVVTDLHMPGLDGIGLVLRMKASARWASTPVVVVTPERRTRRVEGLARQGAMVVFKPFSAEDFKPVYDRVMPLLDGGVPISSESIFTVARRVVETLAFTMVASDVEADVDSYENALSATVGFKGPWSGRVTVTTSPGTLCAFERNMLGLSDCPGTAGPDILAEVTSIIAGMLIDTLFGPRADVELGLAVPDAVRGPGEDSTEEPMSAVRLLLDEGWMEVSVTRETSGRLVRAADPVGVSREAES